MVEVVPSILTNDPQELKELINRCEGQVDRVSIDIIDGHFVDNKTIDPSAMNYVDTNLRLDFQLMTKNPTNWIEKCFRAQADRIIGHIELMEDQDVFVGKVQELGCRCGLAIDIDTPIKQLDYSLLADIDVILVMSYKAGFGGQDLDPVVFEKIKKLDSIRVRDDTPFRIHVDGGINKDTIKSVVENGADEVSVGRSLFDGRIKDNIDKLIKSAYES